MEETKSMSGSGLLHIPDNAKDAPKTGRVVACGPGRISVETNSVIPMSVTEGDRVIFPRYEGATVEIDGSNYLVIADRHLLAVLGENNE